MGEIRITDHGTFIVDDGGAVVGDLKIACLRNEAGNDWYAVAQETVSGGLWVELNRAGIVMRISRDASLIFPAGYRVLWVEGGPLDLLGKLFDGERFVEAPAPVPREITRRQCAIELHARMLISDEEAIAMVAAARPPDIVAQVIAALPVDQRLLAEIDFAAESYERENPLLLSLFTASGASSGEVDHFFRLAAQR